jgi:hypothetical protein
VGEPSARGSGIGAHVEYALIYYVFFHLKLTNRHFRRHGQWLDVHVLALHEEAARSRGYDQKAVTVMEGNAR